MMTFAPLTSAERSSILAGLNRAARKLFPGLLAPIELVARAVSIADDDAVQLDDLPSEVISAVQRDRAHLKGSDWARNRDFADDGMMRQQLRDHLFQANRNPESLAAALNADVWPIILRSRRIDEASFRTLWDRMIASRIENRLCVDLLLDLAQDFFDEALNASPVPFCEIAIFNRVWSWPQPLCPSQAYAIRQVLDLAVATNSLHSDTVWSWAARTGHFAIVQSMPLAAQAEGGMLAPRDCIQRFARMTSSVEGCLIYLAEHVVDYLSALDEHERDYYEPLNEKRAADCDDRRVVPSLPDLKLWTQRLVNGDVPPRALLKRWGLGSVEEYGHGYGDIFAPLQQLLPVLFYVETSVFHSEVGRRIVEQAERWLCYRECSAHRNGNRELNFREREVAQYRLLLDVLTTWHNAHDEPDPSVLLSRVRQLLDMESVRACIPDASILEETSSDARHALDLEFRLLPLRLLELRALRLHGRGTAEWDAGNRLAASRFGFLACRVNLGDLWCRDPGTVLLTLEAVRQLAVARAEMATAGDWDPEMRRCAQQLLVRLELIDDARVRRAFSSFFYATFASIAAWATVTSNDPLEGLCLFELARSRWVLDHLGLANRTLQVQPNDGDRVRILKDRLFEVMSPRVDVGMLSEWRDVSEDLLRAIDRESPDLARLVASNWLSPDEVRRSIPNDAVICAYELEVDAAVPPTILLNGTEETSPSIEPGENARLWMFLLSGGQCYRRLCDLKPQDLHSKVSDLRAVFERCRTVINDQPAYKWMRADLSCYEQLLGELSMALLHPWQASGLLPQDPFKLLVIPSGKLFEIPWPAMPLARSGDRLVDAAFVGIMPGLGLSLWSSSVPAMSNARNAELIMQASPDPPTGLALPGSFTAGLANYHIEIAAGRAATPHRALDALQTREVVFLLCHGAIEGTAYLELYPPTREGRLTIRELEAMPPADHVRLVLLGACWSGLEVRHAAEDLEGLASTLLLKGVRAVLCGTGSIPVELIAQVADMILSDHDKTLSNREVARRLQAAQVNIRARYELPHPWVWASLMFHGVPWD